MKIFISWSGERSKGVATALKEWLPDVFQGVDIFMSEHDIEAGSRWGNKLNSELEKSLFGIVCLTPENLNAKWLLFEAGALSKAIQESHVVPYLLGLKLTDVEGPLAQFQGVTADEGGTYKLLQSINKVRELKLSEEHLKKAFSKWWTDLQMHIGQISLTEQGEQPQRSDRALLEEVLQIVRSQNKSEQNVIGKDPTIWQERKTIHNVTEEEIGRMTDEELKRFMLQCTERYSITTYHGEEDILEIKMATAQKEMQRRALPKIKDGG